LRGNPNKKSGRPPREKEGESVRRLFPSFFFSLSRRARAGITKKKNNNNGNTPPGNEFDVYEINKHVLPTAVLPTTMALTSRPMAQGRGRGCATKPKKKKREKRLCFGKTYLTSANLLSSSLEGTT
jgi:hypothetical protein